MVRPGNGDKDRGFWQPYSLIRALLIVGYRDIIEASLDISEEDLQRARRDNSIKRRVYKSPLRDVLLRLVDFLETDSEESQSLEKEKSTLMPAAIDIASSQPLPDERASSESPALASSMPPFHSHAFHSPIKCQTTRGKFRRYPSERVPRRRRQTS